MAHKPGSRIDRIFPELKPVFAAAKDLKRENGRYAFHTYLTEVYRVGWHWSRRKIRKQRTKDLAYVADVEVRRGTHSFRAIIDATYPSLQAKMASRWTRALEFALAEQAPVSKLQDYLQAKGGVAKCARKAALMLPKRTYRNPTWD